MSKISDPDLQRFFDKINTGPGGIKQPEPAFQRYRKHFLRNFDWNSIKKYSPEQIIQSARTQEELIIIGEFLQKEWGRDHWWWKLYHYKRIQLGYMPSLLGVEKVGTPEARSVWGVPVEPKEYLRYKNLAGPQARAVDRRLFPKIATYQQVTGQKALFNLIDSPDGPKLKNWTGFKTPTLKSNISKNTVIFDLEATGLLGQNAQIVSMGIEHTGMQSKEVWFAPFDKSKKHAEFIEQTIYPQWVKASAGKEIISERALIENAIGSFEKTKNIMGYNIKSYDIPLLYERAKTYGLHTRFEKAVSKANIVDVAEQAQSFISSQIGGKYLGWQQGDLGLKPLGWKLETVAESLGYVPKGLAHEASEDVAMTRFVFEKLQPSNIKASQAIFQESVTSGRFEQSVFRTTGKELLKFKPGMGSVNFAEQMLPEEQYLRPFGEYISSLYTKSTKAVPEIAESVIKPNLISRIAQSKIIGKATIGSAFRYGTTFTVTNLLFPGNFVKNALGSAAFDATRVFLKKKGVTSWKQWAGAIGADLAFNALWYGGEALQDEPQINFAQQFSGKDDAYNTIEGLHPGGTGLGAQNIKAYTDFGSGWDPLKAIAKRIFKGEKDSFGKMIKSTEFQSALESASIVKELGFGAAGTANLMETSFRGERFQFVRKSGMIFDEEVKAMKSVQESIGPSVYSSKLGQLDMEFFAGKTIGDLSPTELSNFPKLEEEITSAFKEVHKAGYRHGDTHLGNIILANTSSGEKKIGLIDFGAAKPLSSFSPEERVYQITSDLSSAKSVSSKPQEFIPAFMQESKTPKPEEDLFSFLDEPIKLSSSGTYNEIEGLHPNSDGLGAQMIKTLSDFGSGWDPAKALAKLVFKGVKKEEAFSKLRASDTFRSAIREAIETQKGKLLGAGEMGEALEYSIALPGIKEKLPIVVKRGIVPKDVPERIPISTFSSAWESATKRESTAMSSLEGISTPSLYATGEELGLRKDILVMEKMTGKTLKEGGAYPTKSESQKLFDIVKEMHTRGIRHTDLHAGNIMRVQKPKKEGWGNAFRRFFTKETEEDIAIIDFGLSNRITADTMDEAWRIREGAIQAGAEGALGRKITRQEFEEALDIADVQGHYLAGQGKYEKSKRLKQFFGRFLYSQSDTEIINESENLFRAVSEAKSIFGGSKTSENIRRSLPIQSSKLSLKAEIESARTLPTGIDIYGKTELNTFRAELESAKTIPAGVDIYGKTETAMSMNIEKTIPKRKLTSVMRAERTQQLKRMKNFNEAATKSVGIGHRAAKNAGRKHRQFTTIR